MTEMRRERLNRDRVLQAAVELADREGLEAVSMRALADALDVVPMALYKHVAGKEQLLDGMVDRVIAEIDAPAPGVGWRTALRARVLSARAMLTRHPWARRALETRTTRTPAVLHHLDTTIGILRSGGFPDPLTHDLMHAFGSRMWGFTQELFEAAPAPPPDPAALAALAARYPNVAAVAGVASHDEGTVVGPGCDDQREFEFALDLMLDAFARLAPGASHT